MIRPSVLLTTEGSYPFHRGDVSRWCDALTTALSDVDFTLLAVTTHPYLPAQYALGANIKNLITVPVSGMEDPAEYGNHASLPDYFRRRVVTTASALEADYLPHLELLFRQLAHPPRDRSAIAQTFLAMHLHLRHCDYHATQTHPATWATFTRVLQQAWLGTHPGAASPSTADVLLGWRLFYRLMLPLAVNVPGFDLAHAATPGFCGLPCVMAKLQWRTPYLLSEHGAYIREHYLRVTNDVSSPFVRWFFGRLTSAVVDVNYAFADQVSPVCRRTAEWERLRGVAPERIRTIHNGVRPSVPPAHADESSRRTIVSVGEFSPLKGQVELIEAAALLRRTVPDLQLRLHGTVEDERYFERCRELVDALKLSGTVVFAGEPGNVADALGDADVFVLTSLSEGLPYAMLDAMFAELPIVATDVGGVREALGEGGLVVPPGDLVALVEALGTLLEMRDSARLFGQHARQRALKLFTEERWAAKYRASYDRLTGRAVEPVPAVREIRRTAGERRSYRREAARLRA